VLAGLRNAGIQNAGKLNAGISLLAFGRLINCNLKIALDIQPLRGCKDGGCLVPHIACGVIRI